MAKKKSYSAPTTTEDKKWQARCDARTLAEAATIKKDAARMKAAKQAAKPMVKEMEENAVKMREEAKAIKRIAKKGN